MTAIQTEYILSSRRRANGQQRRMISVLFLGFVVSVVLMIFAIYNSIEARSARDEAREAEKLAVAAKELADRRADDVQSLLLADTARELQNQAPGLAIALALEANKLGSSPAQAQRTLADIAYASGIKRIFSGFKGAVESVRFNVEQTWAVSGSFDGSTIIWDIATGEQVFYANEQALPVKSVAISQDSRMVAAGLLDGSVLVWDVASGEVLHRFGGIRTRIGHSANVNAMVFSLDGKRLYTGGADQSIMVWDIETGALHKEITSHSDAVNALILNPQGDRLYSGAGARDRRIIVWDVETMQPVNQFIRHGSGVISIALSSDGSIGISSSDGNELSVWDAKTGLVIQRLGDAFGEYRINSPITEIGITHDNRYLLTTSTDGRIIMWDLLLGSGVKILSASDGAPLLTLALSTDGRSVLTGSQAGAESAMILWDTESGEVQGYLEGHNDDVRSVEYHPSGQTFATASDDWDIIIWDAETQALLHRLAGHEGNVNAVAYNHDGSVLASGGSDHQLILWDPASGELINAFDLDGERVTTLAFMNDDRYTIAGLDSGEIVIIDTTNGEITRRYTGHQRRILSFAFSPDAKYMVSSSAGRELFQWDLASGDITRRFQGHTGRVLSLAYSPTGDTILSGSDDGRISLWDLKTGVILREFENEAAAVWALDYNPDGLYALSAGGNNTVKLWEIETGEPIRVFANVHTAPVLDITFSPDGYNAVSAGRDGFGVVWRMPSPSGLVEWVMANRYVHTLTCQQKLMYRLVEQCHLMAISAAVVDNAKSDQP